MRRVAIIPVFREIGKIGTVIERFTAESVDEVCLVVDDPDETIRKEIDEARKRAQVQITIIENPTRNGIGFAIKEGYRHALSLGFDLIVVMAGNGKDDPREIPRLTEPITQNGFDYVQGSRFLLEEEARRRLSCGESLLVYSRLSGHFSRGSDAPKSLTGSGLTELRYWRTLKSTSG